jgi:riboflavin biosynthesis pyrimidine reductase
LVNALADNRLAHWWNLSPSVALEKGIKKFGPNVLVESGARMLDELISAKLLDGLYLSVTDIAGGDDVISVEELLQNFSSIERQLIGDTLFIEAKTLK